SGIPDLPFQPTQIGQNLLLIDLQRVIGFQEFKELVAAPPFFGFIFPKLSGKGDKIVILRNFSTLFWDDQIEVNEVLDLVAESYLGRFGCHEILHSDHNQNDRKKKEEKCRWEIFLLVRFEFLIVCHSE